MCLIFYVPDIHEPAGSSVDVVLEWIRVKLPALIIEADVEAQKGLSTSYGTPTNFREI